MDEILQKIKELEHEMIKQTGLRKPLIQLGFSYEFYDWFMIEFHKNNYSFRPSTINNSEVFGIFVKAIRDD